MLTSNCIIGSFGWNGAALTVLVPDERWLDRLSELLGLTWRDADAVGVEMQIHTDRTLRSVATELTFNTQNDLLVWLALTMIDVLAEKSQAFLVHAATLCVGDGAVLLSGPPYAGKSTRTLRARERGLRLLGDDVVLLAPDTLAAAPVPRPMRERVPTHMARSDSDPLEVGHPLGGVLDGEACRLHPRLSASSVVNAGDFPIRGVYFLRRHAGPALRFAKPHRFEATSLLLNHARAWGCKPLVVLARAAVTETMRLCNARKW